MYIIYCDMDGVLVDFEKGYYDLTGTSTKQFPKGDNSFWQPISDAGAEFWATLPWMPDGKELWNYIKKYNPNIRLLELVLLLVVLLSFFYLKPLRNQLYQYLLGGIL